MQKIRVLGACAALGGVALLSGCVGVPADPYYGGYSSGPYYSCLLYTSDAADE